MTAALEESLLALIRRTAIYIPKDIENAIESAYRAEADGSNGKTVLEVILEDIRLARELEEPLCHETSSVHFYVNIPRQFDPDAFEACAQRAVAEATRLGYLQPGRTDPVTGKLFKTNVAPGSPAVDFIPEDADSLKVRLVLKGSGAENASAQYSLPDETIDAPRALPGVHRATLDSLVQAQGNGSGPGVIGVGVGGDRATGYALAHRQLLRPLTARNSVAALARLEKRILQDANALGIGPMGFGGKSTILGVKIGAESHPPGSCFVSISYIGWACRRQGVVLSETGTIESWLYDDSSGAARTKAKVAATPATAPAEKPAATKPAAKKPAAKKSAKKTSSTTQKSDLKEAGSVGKPAKKAKKTTSRKTSATKKAKKTTRKSTRP